MVSGGVYEGVRGGVKAEISLFWGQKPTIFWTFGGYESLLRAIWWDGAAVFADRQPNRLVEENGGLLGSTFWLLPCLFRPKKYT